MIIWGRLFGTFSKELNKEKPIYGLTKNITSWNPFNVATHEYRAIWQDVKKQIGFLINTLGWTYDGEDLRARTLRAKLLN